MKLRDLIKLNEGDDNDNYEGTYYYGEEDFALRTPPYLTYLVMKKNFGEPSEVRDEPPFERFCSYLLKTQNHTYLSVFLWGWIDSGIFGEHSEFEQIVLTDPFYWVRGRDEQVMKREAQEFLELITKECQQHKGKIAEILKNAASVYVENPYYLYFEGGKSLLEQVREHNQSNEKAGHLCRSAFFMFMASFEGFLNLLYESFLDVNLRTDERLTKYLQRLDIDLKLRLAPRFCVCFESTSFEKSEEFARFQSLVNLRNDFLHANLVKTMKHALHEEDGLVFDVSEEYEVLNKYGVAIDPTKLKVEQLQFVHKTIEDMVNHVLAAMKPHYRPEANGWLTQYLVPTYPSRDKQA